MRRSIELENREPAFVCCGFCRSLIQRGRLVSDFQFGGWLAGGTFDPLLIYRGSDLNRFTDRAVAAPRVSTAGSSKISCTCVVTVDSVMSKNRREVRVPITSRKLEVRRRTARLAP